MSNFIEVTDAENEVKVSVNVDHILSLSSNKDGNCIIDLCAYDRDPTTGNCTPIYIECKETCVGVKALLDVVENPYVSILNLRKALDAIENQAKTSNKDSDFRFSILKGFVNIPLLFDVAKSLDQE